MRLQRPPLSAIRFPACSSRLRSRVRARAQTYPNRPITLVVPYPPGGPTDTIARMLADRMRGPLGQPVVIENVSGGGGTIAVTRVGRARPATATRSASVTGARMS